VPAPWTVASAEATPPILPDIHPATGI